MGAGGPPLRSTSQPPARCGAVHALGSQGRQQPRRRGSVTSLSGAVDAGPYVGLGDLRLPSTSDQWIDLMPEYDLRDAPAAHGCLALGGGRMDDLVTLDDEALRTGRASEHFRGRLRWCRDCPGRCSRAGHCRPDLQRAHARRDRPGPWPCDVGGGSRRGPIRALPAGNAHGSGSIDPHGPGHGSTPSTETVGFFAWVSRHTRLGSPMSSTPTSASRFRASIRCPISSRRSTSTCSSSRACASCSPTTQEPARPSWPGS